MRSIAFNGAGTSTYSLIQTYTVVVVRKEARDAFVTAARRFFIPPIESSYHHYYSPRV